MTNPNLALMAALGTCGSLTSSSSLVVNELTTIGSIAALYPYMKGYATLGSGSSDLTAFDNAIAAVNEYTNIATGAVPGPTLPSGYYASSTEIQTLGDILSQCINSSGGHAGDNTTLCGQLFTLATPPGTGSVAPTDTVAAIVDILKNPTTNVSGIFGLLPSNGPFQPTLTASPATWNLPIVAQAATPVISLVSGTYTTTLSISINDSTSYATIYYTTDGSTPTSASIPYPTNGTSIQVASSQTINAIAYASGFGPSSVASATYVIEPQVAPLTFTPAGGPYTSSQSVTIATATPGTSIFYTTNGSAPSTSSTPYTGPVSVSSSQTINAIAAASGYVSSNVGSVAYTIASSGLSYGVISTIAGNGTSGYNGDNIQATSAEVFAPNSVAVDSSGNVYIADSRNNRVRKITASTGVISTVAGTGTGGYSGDGVQATSAQLNNPEGVTVDSSGNIYIADIYNDRIRKVTASTGLISTIAGNGFFGYNGDGIQATSAELGFPNSVAVDSSGNVYIADTDNYRIRKVTASTSLISTVAGNGTAGYNGDGIQATAAEINFPYGVQVDGSGNVFIADTTNNRIRKVNTTGTISTVAGNGTAGYNGDGGQATATELYAPAGIMLDSSGNLYIADLDNCLVRKVSTSGVISTVAGTGVFGYNGDGILATSARITEVGGVAIDGSGNLYIADINNSRVRKVTYQSTAPPTSAPTFSPVAGTYASLEGVTLSSVTPGAAIYYTVDGSTPTTGSTLYTDPIVLSSSDTIKAIAVAPGVQASAVASAAYVISLSTGGPVFSPAAGPYTTTQTVALSSSTPGATIYYTTNGTTPTTSSSVYTGPLTVSSSQTVNAIALAGGYNTSIVTSAAYTIVPSGLSEGVITTVAGNGTLGYSGDNAAATLAQVYQPEGVAVDSSGNVYIADTYNDRIRKVTPAGVITTIAGIASYGYNGDGFQATEAELNYPYGVAVDHSGNIYIADTNNGRIRMITASTGVITTVAGGGSYGDNNPATSASLATPHSVAVDSSGNLYIADYNAQRIRKVTASTGIITTVAGNGTAGYNGDSIQATAAELDFPEGVALDSSGNIYIADYLNQRVRKVTVSTGVITSIAGIGILGYSGDGGSAFSAELAYPQGVAVDSSGNVYIADTGNYRIRKVTTAGIISTVAGTSPAGYNGDGILATSAGLSTVSAVVIDSSGNLYIADAGGDRIRKVTFQALPPTFSPVGGPYAATQHVAITSVDAGASIYYTTDGSAPSTSSSIYTGSITVSASETLNAIAVAPGLGASSVGSAAYTIASSGLSYGVISTYAGNGIAGYAGDGGQAAAANLDFPGGVALDSSGNLYIAGYLSSEVREVAAATGAITTVAGTGTPGDTGDGGQASNAELFEPTAVAVDPSGNLYIADYDNQRIRMVTPTGVISTVAGTGNYGFSGDGGLATSAQFNQPEDIALDTSGNLYIADFYNNRVRKVTPAGIISTVAGTGIAGYSGDGGLATSAELNYAFGVAVDGSGNLYISDENNSRIRKVTFQPTHP
jgi:sugar lactone lactonase YvrE